MRCKPSEFQTVHPGLPDMGVHGYCTDDPPEAVESPDYFAPVADRLRRLDTIRVICEAHRPCPAEAEFRVAHVGRERVVLVRRGAWFRWPAAAAAAGDAALAGVIAAIEALSDDPRNWTKSGRPNRNVLAGALGRPVSAEACARAWDVVQARRGAGRPA